MDLRTTADLIRACAFARYVLPDIDQESAFFTVGAIHNLMPYVQQQQILGACTARGPLRRIGITATQQGGFHANRDHEIRWEWDTELVETRYAQLGPATRGAIRVFAAAGGLADAAPPERQP